MLLTPLQQDTTVSVAPGTRLELTSHTGEIVVRTWNRNAIQVSANLPRHDRLEVVVSGGVAEVRRDSRYSDDDDTIDYRLTVPTWMELELSTVEGDITVEGIRAKVTLSSVEGNITLRGGKEFVSIQSVEGDVSVDGAIARVEINSVDGGITVTHVRGAINAETVDGDITLDDIESSDIETTTVDGNIHYRGNVDPNGRYRFDSHDGDITLEAPQINATLTVSTFDGEFQACGYQVTLSSKGGVRTNHKRFTARVGNGGAQINLESFDGNIYLVKPGCR
ncbi:MAG: DUF4097 family beta strand repeat-containing protein [Gemmatimonadota bacterium]